MQIPGWKWFPLLKGETPARAERSEARRVARGARDAKRVTSLTMSYMLWDSSY
jgi:hypothetical protein